MTDPISHVYVLRVRVIFNIAGKFTRPLIIGNHFASGTVGVIRLTGEGVESPTYEP